MDIQTATSIIDRDFIAFDTARQNNPGKADGKISENDLKTVAENREGRFTDEQQAAAQFLLDSEASYSFLDVGAGRGRVDGTISRADIDAALETLESGSYYDELLDTAAGRGRRDEYVSNNDVVAALSDPGVPSEVKDAINLLLLAPEGSEDLHAVLQGLDSDDIEALSALAGSPQFGALSGSDQRLIAEAVRGSEGAAATDIREFLESARYATLSPEARTAALTEFALVNSAEFNALSSQDQSLVRQALLRSDTGDLQVAANLKSLIQSEAFGKLDADEQTAVLSQARNYPDARSIANLERLAGKDWFQDFDLGDTQRAAKMVAFLSQYDEGNREIIDNTLELFLAEDAPYTFDFTATRGYGSASGTHFKINPAHITADNGMVDMSERSADRGELRVIGHTVAHEVSHLRNEDGKRNRDTVEDFHVEYRAFYVGVMAQHDREPTVADVIDRLSIFVNRDGAYDHMSDILDRGDADAQDIVDYVNHILGRDDITLDNVIDEVNDLVAELQAIEADPSLDLSDPEYADHVLNRPAGVPEGERNNLDNA